MTDMDNETLLQRYAATLELPAGMYLKIKTYAERMPGLDLVSQADGHGVLDVIPTTSYAKFRSILLNFERREDIIRRAWRWRGIHLFDMIRAGHKEASDSSRNMEIKVYEEGSDMRRQPMYTVTVKAEFFTYHDFQLRRNGSYDDIGEMAQFAWERAVLPRQRNLSMGGVRLRDIESAQVYG